MKLYKIIEFIETIKAMWKLRNENYVYVSSGNLFVSLCNSFGDRVEVYLESEEYIKGYLKGVESALFDCNFPTDYVLKNTEYLKRRRVFTKLISP